MKKIGVLHIELSAVIASMAHEEYLVIGDAGLPVPDGVKCIDLALKDGVPGFLETLEAVMSELKVQEAIIDTEMAEISPHIREGLNKLVAGAFPIKAVPHRQLKELTTRAKAVVRTGEFTPYSNIVLVAGVLF
ncbi:MAG: D-ribose pyranase [Firmicutes bacterium]|nr:D-ribose pyranase [Bacillota bacterium]